MTFVDPTTPLPTPDHTWEAAADEDAHIEQDAREATENARDTDAGSDGDDGADKADTRTRTPRTQGARVTPRQVRATIAKYLEIDTARTEEQALIAAVLSVKPDPVEIAAQVISNQRVTLPGLSEVEAIADEGAESPFQAMAKAISYESQHRQIWTVLSELGLVTGNTPQKETSAAMQIAEAATKLTDTHRELFDRVRLLTRKGA